MTDPPADRREGRKDRTEEATRPGLARALRGSALLAILLLLPRVLSGQDSEEQRSAPDETRGCDFAFAVFAPGQGEPRTVRRCPRPDDGPLYFADAPVLDLTHLESVTAAPAGSGSWRVEVRLSEDGARRLGSVASEGPVGPVGVVLDGQVVSLFTPRSGVRSDRMVVLSGVPEPRARAIVHRLRTEARRARSRRDGELWRLVWHPRPGGVLDSAYRDARERLSGECRGGDGACLRDRHQPRDVVTDSVRAEPNMEAPARGVLVARLGVQSPPDGAADRASLGYDLVFRSRATGRERVLRRLGDWGYGVRWYVRARQGEWVSIPGTRGWLNLGAGPIRGGLTSARGDLVTLEEPVTARRGDAGGDGPDVVRLPAGSYLVVRVREGTMWLRPERPSDMPCGRGGQKPEGGEPEGGEPGALAIEVDALFRPDGTARIAATYPRGC